MLSGTVLRLYFGAIIWGLALWLILGAWRLRRRRVRPGSAFLDSMELLHGERQRAALELIQEETTGYKYPEDKDGDLPQLESSARCVGGT